MQPPVYVRTGADVESLSNTEWLLTNGLGGFAMGTASGVPSRRYHGLLIASLRPPVNRVLALHSLAETLVLHPGTPLEERIDLFTYRFRTGMLHPTGHRHQVKFEHDHTRAAWTFQAGPYTVVKSVHLLHGQAGVAVRYTVATGPGAKAGARAQLLVRPFVAMRDFHALMLRDLARDKLRTTVPSDDGAGSTVQVHASGATLSLSAQGATYAPGEQWWHDFLYTIEQQRGYDCLEDLFSPGEYAAPIGVGGATLTVHATLAPASLATVAPARAPESADPEADSASRRRRMELILESTRVKLGAPFARRGPLAGSPILDSVAALVTAADQFVVKRVRPGALPGAPADRETILAGYPWFADWGRDSMIALPGLLITVGRLTEARDVLVTFANACKDGMIPNVFDDYTGQAHYNTVDAALWFLQAAARYFDATGDDATFAQELLPACQEIVAKYEQGTHFGIRMDPADALICAGDAGTQLTWMDAKRDGVVFTPRHGKPVEINALWHSGLREMAKHARHLAPAFAQRCAGLADRAGPSFARGFWNEQRRCLHDVLTPTGPDATVRCNQVFAVSLPHSPLSKAQQHAVIACALERLYTAHGVRTLDPAEPGYKGRFRGRMFERDSAYHNGTAWPWLTGPLAEAVCRAGDASPESLHRAMSIIGPLLSSMEDGCLGQLAECYDGDDTTSEPQQPGGCPAQAWSVAETLRVLIFIARQQAGNDRG
jgi:glycogen debranching enzyme